MLRKYECFQFVRCHLQEYQRTVVDPSVAYISIPLKCVQTAGYSFGKELGSGSQGNIKLAVDQDGNERCVKAVPKTAKEGCGIAELQKEFEVVIELKKEFEIMSKLRNDRIARTFEIFQDTSFYYLVNEPYRGGDLSKARMNASKYGVPITQDWWRKIFRQCFEGLQHLHER